MLWTRLHIFAEMTWQQLYLGAKRGREKNMVLLPKRALEGRSKQKQILVGRETI